MHDVYEPALPRMCSPDPIMILKPSDRIGSPYLTCPPEKIQGHRRNQSSRPDHRVQGAGRRNSKGDLKAHFLDFFQARGEEAGDSTQEPPPRFSPAVGNVANAGVLYLRPAGFGISRT